MPDDRVPDALTGLATECDERGLPLSAAALARHERSHGMAIVSFRLASALHALDEIYQGKRAATGDTQEYAGRIAARIRERMDDPDAGRFSNFEDDELEALAGQLRKYPGGFGGGMPVVQQRLYDEVVDERQRRFEAKHG